MFARPMFWPTVLFVILAALVTTVGLVGENNLGALSSGFRRVVHSRAVLDELSGIRADALAAQSASRGFRMTGDTGFLFDYDTAVQRGRARFASLRTLTSDNAGQQVRLDSLATDCEDMFEFFGLLHELRRGIRPAPLSRAVSARDGQEMMDRVDRRIEDLRGAELALLEVRSQRAQETYFLARLAGLALAVASLLLGVLVYVLFARTVGAQAREMREQHRRAEDLAAVDRRKDEFLAMLGHELRNPLAPIRLALHVLDHDGAPAGSLARARTIIDQQVSQMTRLVDDLMDVSRVALGKLSLQRSPTDMRTLAQAVAEAASPVMAPHGHRFELDLPAGQVTIAVDPARIRQVLHNLLVNAAKYTDPGGAIRLYVFADEPRREVVFRVIDNGRGLTAEERERVFSPFDQGGIAAHEAEGGIGVGLTLARRLVEMHGGSVAAQSPGRGFGSTFEVRLPRGTF